MIDKFTLDSFQRSQPNEEFRGEKNLCKIELYFYHAQFKSYLF